MRRTPIPGAKPERSTEAARSGELGLKRKAGTPATVRSRTVGAVNVAIEVGKHQLEVRLGSAGELFSEPNEPRGIKRIVKRLAELGCARVLIEGGS